jgi:pyruvate/2-oxoglutarate/acetoin dehydrogenase E1 component
MVTKVKCQMVNIPFRFGVADIKREGTDVTIVSLVKLLKKLILLLKLAKEDFM